MSAGAWHDHRGSIHARLPHLSLEPFGYKTTTKKTNKKRINTLK
jgi:hypothetical protein